MNDDPRAVQYLSAEECWELLEDQEIGRLAYRLVDEVHLVPINYVADARAIRFRTGSGNKLLAAALHSDVAFEIDGYDDGNAWSVVARGSMTRLEPPERCLVDLPPRPWVSTHAHEVLELVPEAVTGRRFALLHDDDDRLPVG